MDKVIEYGVLVCLLLLSLASWAIIMTKIYQLMTASRNTQEFLAVFRASESFNDIPDPAGECPVGSIFRRGAEAAEQGAAPGAMRIDMNSASRSAFERIHWGMPFLASIGSNSPFIGLFGTVWGIMVTFKALKAGSTSLSLVGPGISAALIATAAGLAVVIPAVIAYNMINSKFEAMQDEASSFVDEMVSAVETQAQ
jgi:biopolymer transport protein ExbB/TolQ